MDTAGRRRTVDFSPTILVIGPKLLVRRGSGIRFLPDMDGKTVAPKRCPGLARNAPAWHVGGQWHEHGCLRRIHAPASQPLEVAMMPSDIKFAGSDALSKRKAVPNANAVAIGLIGLYQRRLSQRLTAQGYVCSHYPSCSAYGVLAFRKYRFRTALLKTLDRVRDCGTNPARPLVDLP